MDGSHYTHTCQHCTCLTSLPPKFCQSPSYKEAPLGPEVAARLLLLAVLSPQGGATLGPRLRGPEAPPRRARGSVTVMAQDCSKGQLWGVPPSRGMPRSEAPRSRGSPEAGPRLQGPRAALGCLRLGAEAGIASVRGSEVPRLRPRPSEENDTDRASDRPRGFMV